MNCEHVHKVLDAWLDHELDEATDVQLAQHLRACPACAALRTERDALRAALRLLPRHEAPARLRRSIAGALPGVDGSTLPKQPRHVRWWQAAAGAGAAAALAFMLGLWVATSPAVHDEREQTITRHVASLGNGPLVQVFSADRHVVKPWFAGRIDFAPPVRDLAGQGITLVGGRIDSLAGRTAAAVVYRIRQHDINLFVSRAPDLRSEVIVASTLRGFAVVTWSDDGLRFSAVSDLDPRELQRFAELLRAPAR